MCSKRKPYDRLIDSVQRVNALGKGGRRKVDRYSERGL